MTTVKHLFENMLFNNGEDCFGDVNKKRLSPEIVEAVEECYKYLRYYFFDNDDDFKRFLKEN